MLASFADDLAEPAGDEAVPEAPLLAMQADRGRPGERLLRAAAVVVVGDDHVEAEGEALLRPVDRVDVRPVVDEGLPRDRGLVDRARAVLLALHEVAALGLLVVLLAGLLVLLREREREREEVVVAPERI